MLIRWYTVFSVFIPLVRTRSTLIERSHGLVSTPDLNLLEVGSIVATLSVIRTLHLRVVHVLPCVAASEYVVHFFSFQLHFVFELRFYSVHVWACLTKEPEVSHSLLSEEYIGASGTKQHVF